MVDGIDDGKRQFALTHIVSAGLTDAGIVEIIEDVVTNLETETDDFPKFCRLPAVFTIGMLGHSAKFSTGGKECRRLVADNGKVSLLTEFFTLHICQLQNLAFRKRGSEFCHLFHDFNLLCQGSLMERKGKHIVAKQHCHLVVIDLVKAGLATTLVALVHHIIVNKGCGVQKFERNGAVQRCLTYLAPFFSHKQDEDGTHQLALLGTDMRQWLVHKALFMAKHLLEERGIACQLRLYRTSYF